jgi:hypothetical protein
MKEDLKISDKNFSIESKIINWMRFPLACLVVFVHIPTYSADNIIEWLCSGVVASMAVPLFFILSGYLYFINIDEKATPIDWYWRKTKSRLKSLGIPYLFWALLPVMYKLVGMLIHWHGPELLIADLSQLNLYHILWDINNSGPEYTVLWFIRNLLIISICSPIIWFFVKHLKYCILPILIALSILNIWIPFPGFSANSTLFFAIGAWCAIHRTSLFSICKLLFIPSVILTPIAIILLRLDCIPLVVFNVICIPLYVHGAWLLFHNKPEAPIIISSSPMFLYLAHCLIIESPSVWRVAYNILPTNGVGELIAYFSIPLVTIVVLILLNWLLRKIAPKSMQLICGR